MRRGLSIILKIALISAFLTFLPVPAPAFFNQSGAIPLSHPSSISAPVSVIWHEYRIFHAL